MFFVNIYLFLFSLENGVVPLVCFFYIFEKELKFVIELVCLCGVYIKILTYSLQYIFGV